MPGADDLVPDDHWGEPPGGLRWDGTPQPARPVSAPVASPRLLAIMGSGETAPTMVKVHRQLLERMGPPPVPGGPARHARSASRRTRGRSPGGP